MRLLRPTNHKGYYLFWCPGCDCLHQIKSKEAKVEPRWEFNGSLEKPTFSPSYLIQEGPNVKRCHSFIRDGKIQFLGDCQHDLRGKTVDLPNIERGFPDD